jgi:hypothetical protein
MPDNGPSTYLSTLDEFIAHWTAVDAALSPAAMTLPTGSNLAAMQARRTELATELTQVQVQLNLWDAERTNRDNQKLALYDRMKQLSNYVRGMFPQSENYGQLRPLVQFAASPGRWGNHMDKSASTWLQINTDPPAGFTPPLLMFGGYTQANFATDVAELKTTFTAVTETLQAAQDQRALRDRIWGEIKDELGGYRLAVMALLPEDHELVQTIPRLNPLPGHTPDPVLLSGEWNPVTLKADLSWTASADPDLARYDIRACILEPYDTDFEFAVDSVLPDVTTFSTDEGLLMAGGSRSFKVYVVLNTDNEAGSNSVWIQNPGGAIPP